MSELWRYVKLKLVAKSNKTVESSMKEKFHTTDDEILRHNESAIEKVEISLIIQN